MSDWSSDVCSSDLQQVVEGTGEQLGFLVLAIVGRAEIGGVLVEPVHQVDRDLRQPRLGVAIGGGVIAVDIAEIALAVDERVAQREILREPHHRVVDRLVAVRRSEEHTSELQSLMRISYAVFCLKKKKKIP